jgi:hypothetical protein
VDILQCLLGIQSIIRIPGDDKHPVQLFHTSLHDFLTAKSCSGIFYIDPPTRHIFMVINCLKVMAIPLENSICFLGKAQQYASGNWYHHFHQALIEGGDSLIGSLTDHALMTSLTNFVSQSLEFWVNTLILHNNEQWKKVLLSVQERLEVRVICFSAEKCVDHLPSSNHRIVHRICYKSVDISDSVLRYDIATNYQDHTNSGFYHGITVGVF